MTKQTTFSLTQAADLLHFSGGVQNFIFTLRTQRYLDKDLRPYQFCINAGWFVGDMHSLPDPRNFKRFTLIPSLTIRGLNYFDKKFNGNERIIPDLTDLNDLPY
ncbi:phage antirepressor KilAC domain-containing protein [Spirosoma validum]|uniref:Antirepressor protein C-terminal domain-containing protein n=1 Tax=Spirosoma validum TaxID=2771355 RepID=A0A927AZ08_9BACT|nr:phage antirepressor KilAC domain-containing protein [Spirosoma validum]MBD2752480.1 hypothetical protein [Spirosoma validum]